MDWKWQQRLQRWSGKLHQFNRAIMPNGTIIFFSGSTAIFLADQAGFIDPRLPHWAVVVLTIFMVVDGIELLVRYRKWFPMPGP